MNISNAPMSTHELEDDAISDIEGSSLFSDTDSDVINSPADGYFSQRSHPQQLYATNGTTPKSQEATRALTSPQTSPYPASSSHVPGWTTEQTPLLDAGPAPPDYYAATANRRTSGLDISHFSRLGHVQSYGSMWEHEDNDRTERTPRVLQQAGLFRTGRPLQSMSGDANNVDEESQASSVARTKRRKSWRRCDSPRTRYRLILLMLIATITMIAVLVMSRSVDDGEDKGDPTLPVVTPSPTQPGHNHDDFHNPHDGIPTHSGLPGCSYSTFSDQWHYDFEDLSNFTFEEALTLPSSGYSLVGSVSIRIAPDDQRADVRVTMSFATSAGIKIVNPEPIISPSSIRLEFPDVQRSTMHSSSEPCINAGITIDVKKGLQIEDWTINTAAFDISVPDRLFHDSESNSRSKWLSISNTTTLATVSGEVDAAYWSSRETVIRTVSGSVHGEYALRDLLSITTVSGSVTVDVDPKEADKEEPLPAVFKTAVKSGSTRVTFPVEAKLPDRDYETTIDAISGSVSGSYVHGSTTIFRSRSGSLTATILPFDTSHNSSLSTQVINGATNMHILTPYGRGSLKHMHSRHDSPGSGSIALHYPPEWEGSFVGRTTSGSLSVHGPGVKIDWFSDLGFFGGKKIVGRKGVGHSLIDIHAISGSVDLGIGEEFGSDPL